MDMTLSKWSVLHHLTDDEADSLYSSDSDRSEMEESVGMDMRQITYKKYGPITRIKVPPKFDSGVLELNKRGMPRSTSIRNRTSYSNNSSKWSPNEFKASSGSFDTEETRHRDFQLCPKETKNAALQIGNLERVLRPVIESDYWNRDAQKNLSTSLRNDINCSNSSDDSASRNVMPCSGFEASVEVDTPAINFSGSDLIARRNRSSNPTSSVIFNSGLTNSSSTSGDITSNAIKIANGTDMSIEFPPNHRMQSDTFTSFEINPMQERRRKLEASLENKTSGETVDENNAETNPVQGESKRLEVSSKNEKFGDNFGETDYTSFLTRMIKVVSDRIMQLTERINVEEVLFNMYKSKFNSGKKKLAKSHSRNGVCLPASNLRKQIGLKSKLPRVFSGSTFKRTERIVGVPTSPAISKPIAEPKTSEKTLRTGVNSEHCSKSSSREKVENISESQIDIEVLDEETPNHLSELGYEENAILSAMSNVVAASILAVIDFDVNPQFSLNCEIESTKDYLAKLSSEDADEVSSSRFNLKALYAAKKYLRLFGSFAKVSEYFLRNERKYEMLADTSNRNFLPVPSHWWESSNSLSNRGVCNPSASEVCFPVLRNKPKDLDAYYSLYGQKPVNHIENLQSLEHNLYNIPAPFYRNEYCFSTAQIPPLPQSVSMATPLFARNYGESKDLW